MTQLPPASVVSFMHPALAVAAVGLGLIPLVVHLIARRRFRPVVWAAMPFLMAAKGKSRRRVWLEQWLVMLIRMAALILLGLAVARPFTRSVAFVPAGSARMQHVILLDNSLSMQARLQSGTTTRFETARRVAEQLVSAFPAGDAVGIATLSSPAETLISHGAFDRRLVKDHLSRVEASWAGTDTAGGLRAAAEILAASDTPPANRTVYLISDLSRRAWLGDRKDRGFESSGAATPAVIAARRLADGMPDPQSTFNVIRIGAESERNVAVTALSLDSALVGLNLPMRLAIEVTNFGQASERGLAVQISSSGRVIRREPLAPIEGGESAVVMIPHQPSNPGTHAVEARLVLPVPDSLEADDARVLSLEVPNSIPVLLVDGRPGRTLLSGQAGFLATALSPETSDSGRDWRQSPAAAAGREDLMEVKVITAGELRGEAPKDYDVVCLCNVQRLAGDQWQWLERFVSDGGGLLVFGGDLVDVDDYNRAGYAEGKGLLPVEFGHFAGVTGDSPEYTSINQQDLTHPIVADFADHADSGLFLARIEKHLPARVDPGRGEVVLRYADGDPAMVTSSFGKGRVVVCTTTANMDWNNLPGKGDYVSLVLNTIAHLAPRHGQQRNLRVGQSLREALSPAESSLPLCVVSDAGKFDGRLVPVDDGLAVEYGPVPRPGILSVVIGSQSRDFAANVDVEECDLEVVDSRSFLQAVDRPVNLTSDLNQPGTAPPPGQSTELATVALYVVALLLLVEAWTAMWFGSWRDKTARSVSARGR